MKQLRMNKIKIATYNVLADCYVADSGFKTYLNLAWEMRFPLIVKKIRECDPDVIALHEVDKERLSEWREQLGGDYDVYLGKKASKIYSALCVRKQLGTFTVIDTKQHKVPGHAKGVLVVGDKRFLFATAHLKSGPDAEDAKKREAQLAQLAAEIVTDDSVDHSFYLMDANCNDVSVLQGDQCCKGVEVSTFKERINAYRADKNGVKRDKIDHIVHVGSTKDISFEDVSPEWTDELMPTFKEPSDHRLLACVVTF